MEAFCELFHVPKWLRKATRLMTGMQISITDDTLIVKQVRTSPPAAQGSVGQPILVRLD